MSKFEKINIKNLRAIANAWKHHVAKWSVSSPYKAVYYSGDVEIRFNTQTGQIAWEKTSQGTLALKQVKHDIAEPVVLLRPNENSWVSNQAALKSLISCIRQAVAGYRRIDFDGNKTCVVNDSDTPSCWQKKF